MPEPVFGKSVAVFSAHPDDAEFFVSGALRLLADKGWTVTICTMTAGGMGGIGSDEETTVRIRLAEAAEKFKVGKEEEELFSRLKKTSIGNFLSGLDSVENICHTHAEGYFNGCLPFEYLGIIEGIDTEDAAAFIRDAFDVRRLAVSIVNPMR